MHYWLLAKLQALRRVTVLLKLAGRGLGDAWSASVVYDSPVVVAGIAYDKAIPSNFGGRGIVNAATPEVTAAAAGSAFAAANTLRAYWSCKY